MKNTYVLKRDGKYGKWNPDTCIMEWVEDLCDADIYTYVPSLELDACLHNASAVQITMREIE